MKFIFQTVLREFRTAWRRLLLFFLCIAIGVGSIVALRSMIQNINRAVAGEARLILTADVQVDTGRPWNADTLAVIDRIAASSLVKGRVETVEGATMLRPADETRAGALMIELKGIEPPFPMVGEFNLATGEPFNYQLIANHGAVVSTVLLERLNLKVGDDVKLGDAVFQLRGAFNQEPGDGGAFRLGPRVFIERPAVESTGLLGFATRARRKILLLAAEGEADNLVAKLKTELKNSAVNIRSYRESQENINEQLGRAENYLSLTGLIVLVLGGIGISNVTYVFIEQRKKTIAILKCLGATGNAITAAYLAQVALLGLIGSLLGVLIGKIALALVAFKFAESLPADMSYQLSRSAIAQGFFVGLLISLIFSILPLLRIRKIRPNLLLRNNEVKERRIDLLRTMVAIILGGSLLMLVSWQAGSFRVGLYFLVGLLITASVLHLAALVLIAILKQLRSISSFALRQAIGSLYRPGNQTRLIVMVVGLGVFLILSIQSLQANLVDELDINKRGILPNMFLIDIQTDQVDGVVELIKNATGIETKLIPTIRARITAINDREVDLDGGMKRDRGRLGREYVVTYRDHLDANEQISSGSFWPATASDQPEVSIDESLRGAAGLEVGSKMTFDIQGRKITAKVTSIRKIDWRNSRTGFIVLFRPGTLENAPTMYVGAIDGPLEQLERARFQRVMLDKYPNISVIDVAEIIKRVKRILNNVSLAISFIGGFVFLSGALILIGSIVMTKFQRVYETAILKTLGTTRRTLLAIQLIEFALLGAIAAIIGSAAATALSYAISKYIFKISWNFTPAINIFGIVVTVAIVMVVGALSTYDLLMRKPLATLRAE